MMKEKGRQVQKVTSQDWIKSPQNSKRESLEESKTGRLSEKFDNVKNN